MDWSIVGIDFDVGIFLCDFEVPNCISIDELVKSNGLCGSIDGWCCDLYVAVLYYIHCVVQDSESINFSVGFELYHDRHRSLVDSCD